MKFTPSGGRTATGPAEWFTGTVYIDSIRTPDEQSCVGCAHVRFSPGARTAWHIHPRGQTLYVTDGMGYVGRRDGPIQEADDKGQVVTWGQHVTNDEYGMQ